MILRYILITLICVSFFAPSITARDAKLERMHSTCAQMLDKFDYDGLTKQAAQYIEQANKHGDKRDQAYAYFYAGAAALFTNQVNQAHDYLDRTRKMGAELENDSLMALSLNSIGIYEATVNMNMYLAQWYFMESLKHAKRSDYIKLEGSIYGNMCTIAQMQQDTTVIGYARECYQFGIREKNPHVEFLGALHLGEIHHLKGELDSATIYISQAIEVCKKHDFKDIAIAYVELADILFDKGQLADAERYAEMAIKMAEENSNKMVLANAYDRMARICHEKKLYQESNRWLERELETGETLELVKSQIYELMALNYEAMGNKDEALRCMTRAKELADSTNASDREHMKRERDMSFSIIDQERQLEFNRRQLQNRSIIIGSLIALVLLLGYILWISIRNLRRRNALYKNIVRQQMESIEREKELNSRIKELETTPSLHEEMKQPLIGDEGNDSAVSGIATPSEKSRRIYNEVCRLMEEERLYTDSQLNRESLAQMVGTNKSYLTNIISECSGGMNLSQFINQYRLQEAIRMLSDKQHIDYPLKQLAADFGFGSISTFYKLFQDKVGMSPSAYRKSFIEVVK